MRSPERKEGAIGKFSRAWMLAGAFLGSTIGGHQTVQPEPEQAKTVEVQLDPQAMTIWQARNEIRIRVGACVDCCNVCDGMTLLHQCWSTKTIDGQFLADLDESFSEPLAENVRRIAALLREYPEMAPEIPEFAREKLHTLSPLNLKRAAECFLCSTFNDLQNPEYVEETAIDYLTAVETDSKKVSLLTPSR